MSAYYNEIDPLKAEILREAIRDGAIAPGDVDERSISDVRGDDLRGYTQCHFFAGGGFWSLAARQAGWPDDEPLWTGSCPCPSFSAAGKGEGFDDPRHLWPDWARLIRERKPAVIVGEQADDAVGFGWLDLVQTDLEAQAYAVGKIVFGAHSVGAPHIRQRLYFCADAASVGHDGRRPGEACGDVEQSERSRDAGECADALHAERRPLSEHRGDGRDGPDARRPQAHGIAGACGEVLLGLDSDRDGSRAGRSTAEALGYGCAAECPGHLGREWRGPGWLDPVSAAAASRAGATRGFWAGCDWWYGRDGLYRPIGPGLFPLAHGSPDRVGRLRLFGDAIVVTQAAEFLQAWREARRMTA